MLASKAHTSSAKKLGEVDFIVRTPSRDRLCHINMLKPYVDGSSPVGVVAAAEVVPTEENAKEPELPDCLGWRLENSACLSNMNAELPPEVRGLILMYSSIFPDVPSRTTAAVHDVDVGDARPVKQNAYRVNPLKAKMMNSEVDYMLKHGIIQPSRSPWSSPCLLVPKDGGKSMRFCTDFRKVNSLTKTDCFPLPRIDDCIDMIGCCRFVSKIDLLKGYWQVPLTERAREISAFVTPNGFWEYLVMPFGMKNSPSTFQRMMTGVISGLPFCHVYIDDVIVGSSSWKEHLDHLEMLFQRLQQVNLTVNLKKCAFGKASVVYLGHVVGQGQVRPVKAKVKAILEYPAPTNTKQLMRFIGMAGFYRKFCRNFSVVIAPLTDLLKKNARFRWDDRCVEAFDHVKEMLADAPVLISPVFERPFSLMVDASDVGAGAVLQQELDGALHPVAFYSTKFDVHQRRYSTVEKEALALLLAVKHFEVYLAGSPAPIVVYTDHNPLSFISRFAPECRRVYRWSLYLQEFAIEIRHIRGRLNVVADSLSRC